MDAPVALLLTDVVDSTRLGERLGDVAMAALWCAHDQMARDLLGTWNGTEIDRSDGFLMCFPRVADAVGYALDYHRGLGDLPEPMQSRAGIHVGPLRSRPNSSVDIARGARPSEVGGLSIHVAARIMSVAVGGQTLLTSTARTALDATPHRTVGHGHWRLKGIEEPVELFEVGEAQAPFTRPPDGAKAYGVVRRNELWLPRREVKHSLPAERNAFVGRTDALTQLSDRLERGARLISVLGPGGTGKTRLTQRFGWGWLGDFDGGVWFCDLSQATSLDGVVSAVARGLEVPLGTTPPVEQLGAAIAGRGACLVLLDNFEQVTEFAAATLGAWLDHAPEARFLVTTRNVLNLDGEEVFHLPQMESGEGAALFIHRAKAATKDFRLLDSDVLRLDALIALLDGLPLAIELAAARVRIMSIATLVDRMRERFRLLASARGRVGRHATLRATLDWSWDLLEPFEKAAIAQASVFEGGFDLPAFEAVVDLTAFETQMAVIDVLQSLVDKSWIQAIGGQRFGLLRSVLEYADEKLAGTAGVAAGAQRDATHRRHWVWYASHTKHDPRAEGPTDLDNYVSGCRRATRAGEAGPAACTLDNAWQILKLRGPFQAVIPLARAVLAMPDLSPADRALVRLDIGSALRLIGSHADAEACFDAGLADARDAGKLSYETWIVCELGELRIVEGRNDEALALAEAAVLMSERAGDPNLRCVALNALGNVRQNIGALEEASRSYSSALDLARDTRDLRWEGGLLGNLGNINYQLGRLDEARDFYEQALKLVQQTGERRWEGNTRCNLGLLCSEQNRPAEARAYLESALSTARQLGHRRTEFAVLCNLGILAEAESRRDDARELYEASLVIAEAINDRGCQGQSHGYLGLLLGRCGQAQASAASLAIARNLLTVVGDRWNLALVLCGMVEIAAGDGRIGDARLVMSDAESTVDGLDSQPGSTLALSLARARCALDEAIAPHATADQA